MFRKVDDDDFVCVEVLLPSQPSVVMSSTVSLPNHTFTGQALSSKRLTSIVHILLPETDNCPSWISRRERMTVENISRSISTKECCRPRRGWTRKLLVSSRTVHPTEPPRLALMMTMVWSFTSLSTLFKSYQDDTRTIMKGSVQWSPVQSWAEFCLQPDANPGPSDPKSGVLTTWASEHFHAIIYKQWRHWSTHTNAFCTELSPLFNIITVSKSSVSRY